MNATPSLLPPNDPQRTLLHNEVHARPPARIRLPALVTYVAVFNDGLTREQECEHLRRLPMLLELSRRARATINLNFLIGLAFIVGGLALAMLGRINPVVAAILHNAGSLIVVFNSARLVRHGEEAEAEAAETSSTLAGLRPAPAA